MTAAPPRRRWFSYSLRTFFVLVTIFGVWLGVQVKWIKDRRAFLVDHPIHGYMPEPPAAPGLLWLFGEEGVYAVVVVTDTRLSTATIPPEVAEARRLFPESRLVMDAGYTWLPREPWLFPFK